jgi:hypothetical protein
LDDDPAIPRQTYAFVSIQSLPRISPSVSADVIGVVVAVGNVESKTARAGVVPRIKLTLADDSGHSVGIAVWGDKARRLHAELTQAGVRDQRAVVAAVKGAKVYHWSEGDGVSLTAWETCALDLNPDIERTTTLTRWWKQGGGSSAALHPIGPPIRYARCDLRVLSPYMLLRLTRDTLATLVTRRQTRRSVTARWPTCAPARPRASRTGGAWRPPC